MCSSSYQTHEKTRQPHEARTYCVRLAALCLVAYGASLLIGLLSAHAQTQSLTQAQTGAKPRRSFRPRHALRHADSAHGDGVFGQLEIPSYAERQANRDLYLPATPQHPSSSGRFRFPASATDPSLADLGLWNVYANADYPDPQPRLQAIMCPQGASCDPNQILPLTIGRFKTPVLRDLAQSQPYLHTGHMDTIEKVLDFYRHTALLAQSGKLRDADPEISLISIDETDEKALAAFLRSLNEDYE